MPTMVINTEQTFSTILLMSCSAKLRYGSTEQDVSAAGEKKWTASCAVTFHPEYGMQAQSDVLAITVTSGTDPAAGIAPGTPVELANLRVGISAPEQRSNDRGSRIVGGKPYWMCSNIRPAHGQRKADAA